MILSLQQKDNFIYQYMNMLGHHEFGIGHKFFEFHKSKFDLVEKDQLSIEYWIETWRQYYSYAYEYLNLQNVFFVSYESLCENPKKYLDYFINEKNNTMEENLKNIQNKNLKINSELKNNFEKVYKIYNNLKKLDRII